MALAGRLVAGRSPGERLSAGIVAIAGLEGACRRGLGRESVLAYGSEAAPSMRSAESPVAGRHATGTEGGEITATIVGPVVNRLT